MVPSNQLDPAALRELAAAVEVSRAAKAIADEANAKAAQKGAAALLAQQQAFGGMQAATPPAQPPAPPASVTVIDRGGERRNGNSRGSSNLVAIMIGGLIAAVFLVALIVWLVWLTAGKADSHQIVAVHKVATSAQATAAEAKATANAASSTAGAAMTASLEAKKDAASAVVTANSANTKVDALIPRVTALEKAQAAVNARHAGQQRQHLAPAPQQSRAPSSQPDAELVKHGCKVFDQNGKVLADFLSGNNPKKIVVTTKAQCLQERDALVNNNPKWKTLDRQNLP